MSRQGQYKPPVNDGAERRDEVIELTKTDWRKAVALALEIWPRWYRHEALTYIAHHSPATASPESLAFFDKYVNDSKLETDAFREIATLQRVMEDAVTFGHAAFAQQVLELAMSKIDQVTPDLSRAAALDRLANAAAMLGTAECERVCRQLLDVAAILYADRMQRIHKWGRSYIHRAVEILLPLKPDRTRVMIADRFGPVVAARYFVHHQRDRHRRMHRTELDIFATIPRARYHDC